MAGPEVLDRGVADELTTGALPATLAAEVDHLAGRSAPWCAAGAGVHAGVRARALVTAGDHEAARHVLAQLAGGPWPPQGLAAAAWAAARVGPPGVVAELSAEVGLPHHGFLFEGEVPLGPRTMFLGMLAAAGGDLEAADDHLAAAVDEGDQRAPVWGALARLERARVLLGTPGDAAQGRARTVARALAAARTFFAASGYAHLHDRGVALTEPPEIVDVAAPNLGHLVAGRAWTLGFGAQPAVTVAAGKGLVALRHLILNRHRRVPAVELDGILSGEATTHAVEGSGGAADLDELRARLVDGRARSRTTKLLRRTIERVRDHHALLGAHLAEAVRTGHACSYEAPAEVRWRL